MIKVHKNCEESGWGTWHLIETECPSMFMHLCEWMGNAILAVHNLSSKSCKFTLDLSHYMAEELETLIGVVKTSPDGDGKFSFQAGSFGYGWYRVLKC